MIHIFIGKGGVGKSTLACALALSKEKVKLFSADPMSNLKDILGENTGIDMEELNVDSAVEEYLKKSVKEVKKAYNYLSALNLDSLVDTIEFTPGIEEHVMLVEIERVINGGVITDIREVILDMPPAGLALRVLGLPSAEEGWLDALIALREKIVERRRALSKISGLREEEDEVLERLKRMRDRISELKKKLQSSIVYVVTTKESLAEMEASRIEDSLKRLGFKYKRVYNMCEGGIPKLPFEPKGEYLRMLEVEKWM